MKRARGRLLAAFLMAAAAAPPIAAIATRPGGQAGSAPRAPEYDVVEKSIAELQAAMTAGTVTSKALVQSYLARIEAYDRGGLQLGAMIALNPDALQTAEALDDERRAKGPRGPLHGIPVVVKDNFETRDMPTTGGSVALASFRTGRDAFQVRKLREAGAVVVGKTNLHELAAGIVTISSLGGQTRNPYDPARNPGGSSGGTGTAVAASFAAAGMGSDTCGSIRIPAANNNLFGLRGTLGLSSRHGIIPLSHTQDIGGPMARTVADLAAMLDATVGFDPEDETTRASQGRVPPSYAEALRPDALEGARIGILTNLFGAVPEDEEVASVAKASLEAMKQAGAETIEVTIPGLDDLLRGSSLINSEFKFDLMDYLGRFPGAPVKSLAEILDRGEFHAALEATFRTRNAVAARETEESRRARVKRDAVRALTLSVMEEWRLDALAYPPLLRKPALVGEPQRGTNCQLGAASGLPSISMPAGFTPDGVPVGIELLGPAWTEARLLALAFAYEQAVRPRRAPAATPPLVGGRPPAPRRFRVVLGSVTADAAFDVVSGRLAVRLPEGTGLRELTLNRATAGEAGPVVARLAGPGAVSGETILGWLEGEALRAGTLYVRLVAPDGAVARGWIR